MADQNQDLPLVVSEILIEMHELRGDVQSLKGEMREVKTALQQMAELMLKQQQQSNSHFQLLMEENRRNTEMIVNAFANEASLTRQRLDQHDSRITRLENNQPNA
jgi:hypothetical protein